MKYSLLLENFHKLGKYHFLLALVTNFSMVLSYYIIVSLAIEQIPPTVYCKDETGLFTKCTMTYICENPNTEYQISKTESIHNWKLKYSLYCQDEIYFQYLTSLVFACSIMSATIMSIFADKFGRKLIFQIEVIGNLISFIVLYFENSLLTIFIGVIINELSSHILFTAMLYMFEYFPKNYYIYLMSGHSALNGLVGFLVGLYAFTFGETEFLKLTMVIISLLILLYSFTLLGESPGWLLDLIEKNVNRERNLERLREEYIFMCTYNNFQVHQSIDEFESTLNKIELFTAKADVLSQSSTSSETFFSFIYEHINDKVFRKRFIMAIYLWIVNQVLFYGTITNLNKFNMYIEHAYQTFFVTFIIGNILVGVFSNKLGLYNIVKYFSMLSIIPLIVLILYFMEYLTLDYSFVFVLFITFEFFSIFLIQSIYNYIPSLFEPRIRSISSAYTKIPAKILLIIMPFILGNHIVVLTMAFAVLISAAPIISYLCY
jgi:MFS family permease